MARRERVIVRRGGRSRSPSWLPVVLVLGLLVVGGIVLWMFLSGDGQDAGGVGGSLVLGLGSKAFARSHPEDGTDLEAA